MDSRRAILIAAMAAVIVCAGAAVYAFMGDDEPDPVPVPPEEPDTVVDAAGRTVAIPENLDRGIVTVGSGGPLRFLSVFDVYDKVIECDQGDVTDQKNGRGYSYAYPYDRIASYHPDSKLSAEVVEQIVKKNPSLVVLQSSVYDQFRELADILGRQVCMVVIHPQSMDDFYTEDFKLTQWYKDLVNLLGAVLGEEGRAAEHIADVEAIMEDIRSLVKGDPGSSYVAGVTFQGSNDWCKTFPIYFPLGITSGRNAYTGDQNSVRVDLDAEEAVKYVRNADRIIIDPSSSNKLAVPNSQLVMEAVYLMNHDSDKSNDKRLFVTLPMVWDYANYDCVLAGAYYLCHLQYGTLTHEQAVDKMRDVFVKYYGSHGSGVLDDMGEFFVWKSSQNGVELPILQEVEIVKKADGSFSTRAV